MIVLNDRIKKKLRKKLYEDIIEDVAFAISLDNNWRKILFTSQNSEFVFGYKQLEKIPENIKNVIKLNRLEFTVRVLDRIRKNLDGMLIFEFRSKEFRDIVKYTHNNPKFYISSDSNLYMGIYSNTIGSNTEYRGIHRLKVPVFLTDKTMCYYSSWYAKNADTGEYFEYSEEILNELLKICKELKKYIPTADVIVFGQDYSNEKAEFLGYDIADGANRISLIETMRGMNCDNAREFLGERLNKYGLFSSEDDANKLIDMYNDLLNKGNVEKFYGPWVAKIYRVNG